MASGPGSWSRRHFPNLANSHKIVFSLDCFTYIEAVTQTCSVKTVVLRNFAKFSRKHLCQSLYFSKVAGQSGTGVSCEFCEISRNMFSYKTPPLVASVYINFNHIAKIPVLTLCVSSDVIKSFCKQNQVMWRYCF